MGISLMFEAFNIEGFELISIINSNPTGPNLQQPCLLRKWLFVGSISTRDQYMCA